MKNRIEQSCGKKGCQIYILPFGATKEEFDKYADFCVEDQKPVEETIKEFIPSESDLDWE